MMETAAAVVGAVLVLAKAILVAIETTSGITPANVNDDWVKGFRRVLAMAVKAADRLSLNPADVKARRTKPKEKTKTDPGVKQSGYVVTSLLLVLVGVSLAACSLVNRPDVETPEERLGEAYAVITATAKSTEQALERGDIEPDTAATISDGLDEADALADDAAQYIAAGDDPTQKLDAAMSTVERYSRMLEKEVDDGQ